MHGRVVTRDEMIAMAKRMVAEGVSACQIAFQLDKTVTTIRRWTDPVYCEHRKRQINERRRKRQQGA